MFTSQKLAVRLAIVSLTYLCCATSGYAASVDGSGNIQVEAPLNQSTSLTITADLLGITLNTDEDLVACIDGTCTLSGITPLKSAQKELTGESYLADGDSIQYTPSSDASAGDTLRVPYEACVTSVQSEGTCTGAPIIADIVFTITDTSSNPQVKDALDTFNDICATVSAQQVQLVEQEEFVAQKEITTSDLLALCASADQATINPEEVVAQFTSIKQQITAQRGNIFKRFKELRSGNTGVSIAGLTYSIEGEKFSGNWLHAIADSIGGGASADDAAPVSNWGFFINGSLTDGNKDGTTRERGYDNDASTATVGADYRFSRELIGGIAYGINSSTLEFDGNNDGMDNDMANLILYGTWYKEAFNLDILIGAAEGEIETERQVSIGSNTVTIGGETDTQQTFFSIAGGYNFSNKALSYGPYASYDYMTGKIDNYQESGDIGLEVGFDEQDIDSQVFTMGGQVSYAISTNWGVVVPHARAEWKKEFDDGRDIISGQFTGINNSTFSIEADDFDSSWFHAAVGVSATFRYGLSAYIDYDSIIAYDDTELNTLSYGGRWEASF